MVQRDYHNYINHMIGDRLTKQPKPFWSYVKMRLTENIGIPTLELKQSYVPQTH